MRIRWAIVLAVVLIPLGSTLACEEPKAATPPLRTSVVAIYQAYQENEARANATYKNQDLRLSFRVDEIEDKYVVQELDGFLTQAELEFDQEDLVEFNVGDVSSATCRLRGLDLDIWLRFDCR